MCQHHQEIASSRSDARPSKELLDLSYDFICRFHSLYPVNWRSILEKNYSGKLYHIEPRSQGRKLLHVNVENRALVAQRVPNAHELLLH
mmetsp:Transcript_26761/g.54767  ORF Transcript_26761/g.54767 Transcript_26761/m.54767 type:complete len:89 (-) Transcript_26761:352-618(-)